MENCLLITSLSKDIINIIVKYGDFTLKNIMKYYKKNPNIECRLNIEQLIIKCIKNGFCGFYKSYYAWNSGFEIHREYINEHLNSLLTINRHSNHYYIYVNGLEGDFIELASLLTLKESDV